MNSRTADSADIVIVGGGIVGCALAYDLTGLGLKVTLLERRELAREASWASAGIISPPVASMDTRVDMALLAYRRYPGLVAEVEELSGISTGFTRTGELMAVSPGEIGAFKKMESWQQAHGIETQWLEGQALREYEPALHESFAAGLVTPQTASIRLDMFTLALARAALTRGATIREFTTVTSVIHSGGRTSGVQTLAGPVSAGAVVVAAGAWSGGLLQSLDVTVPTHPVLGEMMAIRNPPVPIRSIISGGGGYIVPRADGSVAIGATEDPEAGYDVRVRPAGVRWLVDLVERVAPSLIHGTLDATWAGLRPGSADGELIVGKLPHLDNVWVASGHYRSGALLAPATSQWLAQSIQTGQAVDELAPFDPVRFQ